MGSFLHSDQEVSMSNLLRSGVLLGSLLAGASPAAAQYAPWCFSETSRTGSGATSCTFHTYAQCMATRSGIGGFCFPNPYSPPRRQPDKRQPRY
jgi:hypothetical protein